MMKPMTKALKQAFDAAAELPEPGQDELAAAIRAEIEAEQRFDAALSGSGQTLECLAEEAEAEHRAKKTESLNDLG
jgi:uncharacterized protein YqeY